MKDIHDLPGGAHVDRAYTASLIDELVATGLSRNAIAKRLGVKRLRIGPKQVTARMARAVAALHRETFGLPDPEDVWVQLAAVIEAQRQPWRQSAACTGLPIDWFFSDEEETLGDVACAGCPVRLACETEAADNGLYGRWGTYLRIGEPGADTAQTAVA